MLRVVQVVSHLVLRDEEKKLDKRDDLFYHYLKVIKALRPKYFVMENVKGILTKDEGRIKERILREIRSIVDDAKMNQLFAFLDDVLKPQMSTSLYNALYERLCMVTCADNLEKLNEFFFNNLDLQLKEVTRHLPYSVSKSNESVNTIRHGLLLLGMKQQRDAIRKQIIQLKTSAHIDNDTFVDGYNAIIETISDEQILEQTLDAIDKVTLMGGCEEEAKILKKSLELLTSTFDECIEYIQEQFKDKAELLNHLNRLIKEVRLYNIEEPLVLLSSNYGVPQNRERVVFIGCRNDQEVIKDIPATVTDNDKVKVYEAIWDLNMVGNGETATSYKEPTLISKFENTKIQRAIHGEPDSRGTLVF